MRIAVHFLVAFAALLVLASAPSPVFAADASDNALAGEWAKYRKMFVADDGRVVDTGNKKVSHTEGQGFAMLFAETAGDRATFDKVWSWTRSKLQRKDNALFSWRWDPSDTKKPVSDHNDASDGDILIAWSLIRAAREWHEPTYLHDAHRIVAAIRHRLLVTRDHKLVLLPGMAGFEQKGGVTVVNPSYYIYPALEDFARVLPSSEWRRLRRDGLDLQADARFGRWGLTPDWVDISKKGALAPAPKFPPHFGFDAIRVPLYLIWGREATPERLASYLDFWNEYGGRPIPAWADLDNNKVAPYSASTGFKAVIALTRGFGQSEHPSLPGIGDKDDYYSASLTLLAMIAAQESTSTEPPEPLPQQAKPERPKAKPKVKTAAAKHHAAPRKAAARHNVSPETGSTEPARVSVTSADP